MLQDTREHTSLGHAISATSGLVAAPLAVGMISTGTLSSGLAAAPSGPLVAGAALATGFIASTAGVVAMYKVASEIVPDSNSYHKGAISGAVFSIAAGILLYDRISTDITPHTLESAHTLTVKGSCADTEIKIEAGGQKASIILPEGCILRP